MPLLDVPGEPLSVVLVDDDASYLRAIQRVLRREPVRVTCHASGELFLRWLDEAPAAAAAIDVVVLDLRMPGLGGAEILAAMRRRGSLVGVMVSSAFAAPEDVAVGVRAGAMAFVDKGDADALVRKLGEVAAITARRRAMAVGPAARESPRARARRLAADLHEQALRRELLGAGCDALVVGTYLPPTPRRPLWRRLRIAPPVATGPRPRRGHPAAPVTAQRRR
ncbi:MAG: response regulator [Kofleriaceae bacterium]